MVKTLLSILLLVSISQSSIAQKILVLNKETNKPIESVLIYDELGNQSITNKNGISNISGFSNGLLTFQHLGYATLLVPKEDLPETIYLNQISISVNEVVVSANKWEEDISEIPVIVKKISREEIAFQNPQTSADILNQSGEVFIQKSQLGGGSPMIRGFAANSVLISVDGVRMNNAIYRSGNLQNVITLDGLTTESAEVVFGPGSVLYGSDALGGVMDFHTINTQFNNKSGELFTRFSSANLEKTGHFKTNIGGNNLAFLGAFTYSSFDDLTTGSIRKGKYPNFGSRPEYVTTINGQDSIFQNTNINKQVFSGYNQWNALAKLSYKFKSDDKISYAFHATNSSNVPRYDRLTEYKNNILKYAEWYYGPQKWQMHHLQFTSSKETPLYTQNKLTAAYQLVEESRHDRKLNATDLRSRTEKVNILSINADLFKEYYKNTFYYGAEFAHNKVNSFSQLENIVSRALTPSATRYPKESSWTSIAAYASMKYYFSTSLILNTGVRYSQILVKSNFSDKTFYNFPYNEIQISTGAVNGSLGLVWKHNNEFNVKTSFSSGFRAPNVDDIGKVFDSEPGNVVVPNQDLKPEFSYSGEITFFGKINYELEYNFTGYYTYLVDAMVRRDFAFNGLDSIIYDGELSNVQALVNTGRAYVSGISGNLKYTKGAFIIASTLTFTNGGDLVKDVPLQHTAPLFGQTYINFKWKELTARITQRYNGAKPFEQLAPSEQNKITIYTPDGSPAWTTTSVNLQYNINNTLFVNGGVENIFNIHYRPYSSGISASGRNFIISLKANFNK